MRTRAAIERGLLQLGCIIALLFAQHVALTHAIWHVHEHLPAQFQADTGYTHHPNRDSDDGRPSPQSGLCGFHLAFGEVLGGAPGAGLHFVAIDPDVERAAQPLPARLSVEPVPALSRGPPVLP